MSNFIVGHWELFAALVIILFLLARTWFGPGAVSVLMPSEAIQLINHKDALVVDVRTDKEHLQGHVMNSLHIPLGVLENRITELQPYKSSSIVMVCRSGARSGQAASKLKKLGFEGVHNLGGGMLAWERANLPVTTKTGVLPKPAGEEESASMDLANIGEHDVVVYSTRQCPFCTRAIDLLELKGVGYNEIRIDTYPEKRKEMEARSKRTSVPQIFIGTTHVGGCDDMYEVEARGELDALLDLPNRSVESEAEKETQTGTAV